MKSAHTIVRESQATIPVPPGGVTVHLLSRSLLNLVADITERSMALWKSVPPDAQSLQLQITVIAIGEQKTNESSISTTQPGALSPTNLSAPDSSPSRSRVSRDQVMDLLDQYVREQVAEIQMMAGAEKSSFSPTQPYRPPPIHPHPSERSRAGGELHVFTPWQVDGNCARCGMPRMAWQHDPE